MQFNQTDTQELKLTGGAQIGHARASWPFAKLIVTRDKMQLNAGIIGSLVFRPSDVIDVVPYSSMGFSSGIQIRHRVTNYKEDVVFTSFDNSFSVIKQISATGFLSNRDKIPYCNDEEIVQVQQSGGFPIKIPAAIAVVVMWNLL